MSRHILLSASLLPLLAACSFFGVREYQPNPDPNHTHADFAIWIEGMQLDFAEDKYMSGLSTDDATHDEESEVHHKYFHLHDNIGHVATLLPGLSRYVERAPLPRCRTYGDGSRRRHDDSD